MNSCAPLGFAFLGVAGAAVVLWAPGELEIKLAAMGVIGPLTGVAGGIARQAGDSKPPEAPRRRFNPPDRYVDPDEQVW